MAALFARCRPPRAKGATAADLASCDALPVRGAALHTRIARKLRPRRAAPSADKTKENEHSVALLLCMRWILAVTLYW